jgi:hypothetical protein
MHGYDGMPARGQNRCAVGCCKNPTHDTAASWPPLEIAIDAASVDPEDVLGDLTEPALGVESPGTEGMDATDYALPPELHPVLSLVPRSYQVEARLPGCGVMGAVLWCCRPGPGRRSWR